MVVLEAIELRHPFNRSHQVMDWRQEERSNGDPTRPDITTGHFRTSRRHLPQRQSMVDYDRRESMVDYDRRESTVDYDRRQSTVDCDRRQSTVDYDSGPNYEVIDVNNLER